MLTLIFTILPVLFALALIAAAVWEFMTWRTRFADWARGRAVSRGAVKRHGDVGPRLVYEYTIDGTTHEAVSGYMKDNLPPEGEGIRIYYDPANPARSEWYSPGLHNFLMIGTGLIGVLILWLAF